MTSEQPSGDREFGQRIRDRRREMGMSQADLARDHLSASYVSLLEAGKRTPTREIVATLAAVLDCSSEYLLHGYDPQLSEKFHLGVRYAELAVRNGEAADALDQLNALLKDVANAPVDLVSAARRERARALESVGRLRDAIDELEVLDAQAQANSCIEDHVRLTIDLVRCYQEAGDVAQALDLGVGVLNTISTLGLRGTDTHAELVSSVIGAYYVRGDLVTAGRIAMAALRAVEDRGSPRARAAVYWNASLVAEAADDTPGAIMLAERALALYAEGDDERSLARLRVAYGWLLLRTSPSQPKLARDVLLTAHKSLTDVGTSIDIAYCETELARASLMIGRPSLALNYVDKAAARLSEEAQIEGAYVHLVRGGALLALDRRDEAVAEYRIAAGALASLNVARLAAGAWRELADAFTRLELFQDAALAYQQALSEVGVRGAPDVTPETTAVAEKATMPRRATGAARLSGEAPR
jgi:transcriptional regulator with XRE-family HTH domain